MGYASLGTAGVGVAMPLLPTAPFLLLALSAFGKASLTLAARLRASRRLGLVRRGLQDRGAIERLRKWRALAVRALGTAWLTYAVCSPSAYPPRYSRRHQ